jgi:ElaB/YqjD/DUF883 family membrane-anchored ribosome-binding protein
MTQQQSEYPLDYGKTAGQNTADRLRDMADTATEKLKDVGTSAQETAENITAQAREYGEKAQEAAAKVRPFIEKSLKEQPMTMLAGAAVIAFVLGALWKK